MAGGAELIVAWLSEGLAAPRPSRDRRLDLRAGDAAVSGGDRQRRDGHPVLSAQRVLEFRARGPAAYRRALWHLRDAWNRDAGRRFRADHGRATPDIVHTHLIDGFSAAIWRRARRAGVPIVHTAHDYHLLCPRAFMLTRDWRICRDPSVGCRLYRAWHLATARDVDLFVSPSRFLLEQHRAAGLPAAPDGGRAQRHSAAAGTRRIRQRRTPRTDASCC